MTPNPNRNLRKPITVSVLAGTLEEAPQSLAELFATLTEHGYTATSVAETRNLLVASPLFERQGDLWGLRGGQGGIEHRVPAGPQTHPDPTYGSPKPRLTYSLLNNGRAMGMTYPDFDRRLRETLSFASYEGLAFHLPDWVEEGGAERRWRLHRLWYEEAITFCLWTVTNRPLFKEFLHEQGWHLWSIDEPARWDDVRYLLGPRDQPGHEPAVATWRSPNAAAAARRAGSWLADELRLSSLRGVEFQIFYPSVVEADVSAIARRRRVHARTPGGRKQPIRGCCRACGQPLSDDESLVRGYGPVCYSNRQRCTDTDRIATDAWYLASALEVSDFRRTIAAAAAEMSMGPPTGRDAEPNR